MKDFYKIIKNIKSYKGYVVLNIMFNILTVLFSLISLTMVIPFLSLLFKEINPENIIKPENFSFSAESIKEHFYYYIQRTIQTSQDPLDALLFICTLILISFFLRNLFRYLSLYFLTPIRNGIVYDLRNDLHKKMLSLNLSFFKKERRGDIISKMTTDLIEIEWSIMSSLDMIIKDPVHILFFISTLIIISPELTLFVIILFPITGFIIAKIGKSLQKTSRKSQKKMSNILSIINENIAGIKVIKLFNAFPKAHKKFQKESEEYKLLMNSLLRRKDLASPMSEFLSTIVLVITIWFGGNIVLQGDSSLNPEEFIAYILIFSQIIPPAKSLTTSYYRIQKGAAAASRVYELLKKENTILNQETSFKIHSIKKGISIKNVSFQYENSKVLDAIDFSIPKGETIALVGKSGSGKSTIADLCARFYEVEEGEISIDNRNIKNISIDSLRDIMGVVNQTPILFNDTIYNNILIGNPEAKKEEVINAAKIANAHKFILNTKLGYDTSLEELGTNLSGGEKQRISIARAVLKNPAFLILDEATSSLDNESEKLVQDALLGLMKNRTTLVIAHRLTTIQNADKIIVISNGKISEEGTHEELIKKSGVYKELIKFQKPS